MICYALYNEGGDMNTGSYEYERAICNNLARGYEGNNHYYETLTNRKGGKNEKLLNNECKGRPEVGRGNEDESR